jgi:hypothetical protein
MPQALQPAASANARSSGGTLIAFRKRIAYVAIGELFSVLIPVVVILEYTLVNKSRLVVLCKRVFF